jgi:hypothetical protein
MGYFRPRVLANNTGGSTVDDYMKTNQEWWNEAAQGDAYLLKEFKAGMNKLYPLDLEEVGGCCWKETAALTMPFRHRCPLLGPIRR